MLKDYKIFIPPLIAGIFKLLISLLISFSGAVESPGSVRLLLFVVYVVRTFSTVFGRNACVLDIGFCAGRAAVLLFVFLSAPRPIPR